MSNHTLYSGHVNKAVYYCAVGVLAEIMCRGHIDHVIVSMYECFVHLFHSVEGVLHRHKRPIDTKIDIYVSEGKLYSRLTLLHR